MDQSFSYGSKMCNVSEMEKRALTIDLMGVSKGTDGTKITSKLQTTEEGLTVTTSISSEKVDNFDTLNFDPNE